MTEETHWGPDPGHGGLTQHKGRREECSAPSCGPDEYVVSHYGTHPDLYGTVPDWAALVKHPGPLQTCPIPDCAKASYLNTDPPPERRAPLVTTDTDPFSSAKKPVSRPKPQPDEDGVKRDRYGRYLLPHPDTRVEQGWTRVTTLAKSASDTFMLDRWGLRMAMKGLMDRPDLQALVSSTPLEDKDKLNLLGEQAKEAGGSKVRANLGTALHKFSEAVDKDPSAIDTIGPAWKSDIEAYVAALDEARFEIIPEYIERICLNPTVEAAGTFDRILRLPNGEPVIADLKTGDDLSYGWLEIAIQLATYAYATHLWDKENEQWEPMPAVSKVKAVVMHLPVGKKKCDLYWVNIKAGWQGAQLCHTVREWRRTKGVHKPIQKRLR